MPQEISISFLNTVSALGCDPGEVWNSYLRGKPLFQKKKIDGGEEWICSFNSEHEDKLNDIVRCERYADLDRSVKMALMAADGLSLPANDKPDSVGINVGSSRGATGLFEQFVSQYTKENTVGSLASPTTTLGNISSWVAQYLEIDGFSMGHSVTCSSALHAVLNGIAWLNSGMAKGFIAGGSEAPLTDFTVAQMKAIKLYSTELSDHPCRSLDLKKPSNTMILGEAAGMVYLEAGRNDSSLAVIKGFGFATEQLTHPVSLSEEGTCLQRSMKMALKNAGLETIDCIVMHAPGTVKGDLAEFQAINSVFGEEIPKLTSNKWLMGHSLGASGMMSLEMAVQMILKNWFIENPFYSNQSVLQDPIETVMVNAVGFGGNAVSIILEKP